MKRKIFYKRNELPLEFNTLSFSFENSPNCLFSTETSLGEYYYPSSLERVDIKEKETGVGLFLGLKIVNGEDCSSLHGAKVEIWQANAFGRYSEFKQNNENYLRGFQISDELGFVEFETIYPGKTHNRTNHLHLKISYLGQESLITQLFLPQNVNDYIATIEPYKQIQSTTSNFNDPVLLEHLGCPGCWLKISSFGNRFIGTLTIGIEI
ncbi:MAG: hypothetical protein PHX62_05335 [Bacilli bacterium]|nr:hypothetical protein [Bacilli bacterium]